MKRTTKLTLLTASLLSALALTSTSYGNTVFGSGSLTTSDSTFDHPRLTAAAPNNLHYYDLVQFTVSASGTYTFELASMNTTGNPSNALDTYLLLYANSFNPLAPTGDIAFNDDFTGALTVLGGSGTGFTGAMPASRIANLALTAGTQYFMVVTSFRPTTFVGTGTTAQPTGAYNYGITGPGDITVVPEPGTTALFVMAGGALAAYAFRKRRLV
jgi:hypothetical protein